ncbi:girdin-like [Cucumis melo var. makuwa]|uniref:Girdin-like n=1 Tax=Cucumis melo var. makuwa TaxID=1194695 RepID=A0A5D3BYI1_CUCMM|nr:girdin-like [Cucumis melo var. makuwa]TYK03246.1 girdin-like [Cucumis melo var. makuwa]
MSNMSMHSSFESKVDEPSDVLKWAEEMQQKFRDDINNSSQISVLSSHIKFPAEFRCPRLDFSSPWNLMRNTISEFAMAVWDPTYPRKEAWLSFFAKLTSENVIWKAQWMPLKAVIYRCGDFHSVPLLGPWGGVNYTPLLVLRQVWLKQFIPPTHNLQESDFSYDPEDCQGKKCQAVCTWKSIRKIKDKGHYEGVTSGYEAWQANRRKNIIDI